MTNRDLLITALRGELDDGETMLYLLRCPYSWLHRLLGYQPAQPLCAYQDGMMADATCIECKRLWLDAEADTEVEA